MRFFKHFTDNYRGRTVQALIDEMGLEGVGIYYMLIEICAEKLEKPKDRPIDERDLTFSFHRLFLQNNMRCRWTKLQLCLNLVATKSLLSWNLVGNEVKIHLPMLLDLLDRDLKGARNLRAKDAQNPRLELELELELEEEGEKKKTENAKASIVNASANMESHFDPKNQLLLQFIKRNRMFSLTKYIEKISLQYESLEVFREEVNSLLEAFHKKDPRASAADAKKYVEVCIKKQIGVMP